MDGQPQRKGGLMPAELDELRHYSAQIGADPLLVQGAGGNTSVKDSGALWIKASGKWLSEAAREDMFVPVDFESLLDAVRQGHSNAERAEDFILSGHDAKGLRPSIETTVHALLPQKIVVHVHCVSTIARAVRQDAEQAIAPLLHGIAYAFIPYRRPGLPLAKAIAERLKPDTSVLILGNHGLVVAAETVAGAASLLGDISRRLHAEPRPAAEPDLAGLLRLAEGSDFRLPVYQRAHAAAVDEPSCRIAEVGSLYPDHVVFLGAGSYVARDGGSAKSIEAEFHGVNLPPPVSILFPGKGVLMRGDAGRGAEAMAACLAEVTSRIEPGVPIRYLSTEENAELLNWDAEKYRQELNRRKAGAQP
jgi:rhamnose utilization protein RhaD (predicted bifunctional aldolase and dehydrogenase)